MILIMLNKPHVEEVDYLRVFGLISIVVIHSLGFLLLLSETDSSSEIFQRLAVNLLRYGRFVFMFVTGLVLFYNYKDRELNVRRFYKRRLKNLVVPYAIWTAIYLYIKYRTSIDWTRLASFAAVWWQNLLSGNAFYHLYYIVVTIQFYFFFPFLILVFKPRRPRLWAGTILVSGLFLCAVYHYIFEIRGAELAGLAAGTPWAGFAGWVMKYKDRLLFSYLPFYLLGGLAGIYLEEFRKWLAERRRLIFVGLLLSAALVSGEYFCLYRYMGQPWGLAVSVFKPSIYIYSIMVIAAAFWFSLAVERRGTMRVFTKILAANSLGIYLAHPAVLHVLHSYCYGWYQAVPVCLLVVLDPLAAVAISCFISIVLGSNKYTRFIVGEAGNMRLQQISWRELYYKAGFRRAN